MHDSILVTCMYIYVQSRNINIYVFHVSYIHIYIYTYIYTHIYIHFTKCNYVFTLVCDRNTKHRKYMFLIVHIIHVWRYKLMTYIYVWMVSIRQYVCSLISEMKYTTIHILINRIKFFHVIHVNMYWLTCCTCSIEYIWLVIHITPGGVAIYSRGEMLSLSFRIWSCHESPFCYYYISSYIFFREVFFK